MSVETQWWTCRGRRVVVAGAIALAAVLSACSGTSEVALEGSDDPESGFMAADGDRGQLEESISSVPEALGNVDPAPDETSTSTSTTTTTAPPTTTSTTTTTEPVGLVEPADAGAEARRVEGLGVITSPGDPLNVRLGPGTNYGIIAELEHRTVGITSTHFLNAGTVQWRFIEVDGEPAGWVAGRFLRLTGSFAFCAAGQSMPPGLASGRPLQVDVDGDRILDDVAVFREALGGGATRLWIRSDVSSGGVVAGSSGPIQNAPESPGVLVEFISNSTTDTFGSQFLVEVARNGDYTDFQIFDLEGCDLEPTTLNGAPFVVTLGSGANGFYGSGCIYNGGSTRYVTFNDDVSSRTIREYELNGTQWTLRSELFTGVDATSGDFPLPDGFTPCLRD